MVQCSRSEQQVKLCHWLVQRLSYWSIDYWYVQYSKYYSNYRTYLLILIEDAENKMKHSQAGSCLTQHRVSTTGMYNTENTQTTFKRTKMGGRGNVTIVNVMCVLN